MTTKASEARLSVDERKRREDEDQKQKAQAALLRRDFDLTFATESGVRVLRWIMNQCGYQRPSVAADARGELLASSTIYNEARRNLYLQIRRQLKRDILVAVENTPDDGSNIDALL